MGEGCSFMSGLGLAKITGGAMQIHEANRFLSFRKQLIKDSC
jgi:hypothetical protein